MPEPSGPGADLHVPAGPGLPQGLVVPATELTERFSRSSGPGGQSVNTADSRVELVFVPARSAVLTETEKQRLARELGDGPLTVVASEHRSQHRNRVAARDRLAARLREALAPPPPRRVPTKPSQGSQRRRVDAKTQRGRTKRLRGQVRE